MFVASVLVLGLMCCFHQASGVIHSHQYIYTATSGIANFPEFVSVGLVDGQQISYYDSKIKDMIPRQQWVEGAVDADFWRRNGQNLLATQQVHVNGINVIKERFNQTGGVHTWQMMYGCQWDDKAGATDGFMLFGYDGEDFVALDQKNRIWIATTPQSLITKHKWDTNRGYTENQANYLSQICIEWLKKYVQYGSSTLERKVRPEVSLLQKDSEVVCHATGFYPEGVMITWKRNGEEMQEDVDVGETLPNEDGTFQKRAVLTVSPEELKNRQYTCEVAHKSGETIVKTLPGEKTLPEEDGNTLGIIIGCVVAALVVIGVIVAIVMMKKKDYKKAALSDTDSENSNPIARKGAECADC